MQSVVLAAAVLATTAAAQSTTACAAENILQACLSTENALLATCGTNDWDCKCQAYINLVTCYNNCPNDAGRSTMEGQQEIFCSYASAYPSVESTVAAVTTGTATGTTVAAVSATTTTGTDTAAGTTGTTTHATAATATTGSSTASTSSSAAASAATATGGAVRGSAWHAGGLAAGLVGVLAALF